MNKKFLITIIVITLLVGVGIFAWLQFAESEPQVKEKPGPYLTQGMALSLLDRECLAEGDPFAIYGYYPETAICVWTLPHTLDKNQ